LFLWKRSSYFVDSLIFLNNYIITDDNRPVTMVLPDRLSAIDFELNINNINGLKSY